MAYGVAGELDAGGTDGLEGAEFGEPDHDFVGVFVAGAVADGVEEGVVGDVAGYGGCYSDPEDDEYSVSGCRVFSEARRIFL